MPRVFVVYGSGQVAARIMVALQRIPSVRLVGQLHDNEVTIGAIRNSHPDAVLLVGLRMDVFALRQILAGVRDIQPSPKILLMTDHPFSHYKKECMRIGADRVFEISTEFQSMIDLFREDRIMDDRLPEGGVA